MRSIINDGRRFALLIGAALLFLLATLLWIANQPLRVQAQTGFTIAQPSLTVTASQTSFACNWATSSVCRVAVNATVGATPTFLNPVDGGHYILELVQDSIGHPVPLPSNPQVVNNKSTTQATATAVANQIVVIQMDFVASPLSTATGLYNALQ